MRILIITTTWGRDHITALFLDYYKHLKSKLKSKGIALDMIAGVSEEHHFNMVKNRGFTPVMAENNPLGNKFNITLQAARNKNFDYILILGSDDFLSAQAFDFYARNTQFGYIGFLDFYVFDTITQRMAFWPGYKRGRKGEPAGAGRLIKRDIIEKANYKLWFPLKNKGLDLSMSKHLITIPHQKLIVSSRSQGILILGAKSPENLGAFNRYAHQRYAQPKKSLIRYFGPSYGKKLYELGQRSGSDD
jgi:hypothetical protein